jgi:mannose-6-phosphate isomerase
MLAAQSQTLVLDTKGESFHALTVIDGAAQVTLEGESYRLKRFESVIIPASCRKYTLQPLGSLRMLKASVE